MTVPAPPVVGPDGPSLARRAAAAVAARLAGRPPDGRLPGVASLQALGATFVTLERTGGLLGCVGSLEPVRPRYLDAMRNAVRAAADPRLPPITPAQWPEVDVKVSVLTPPEPLLVDRPARLLPLLRPGVDGLILIVGDRRATFLPAVWRKLPEPEPFLAALLQKGGWLHAREAGGGGHGGGGHGGGEYGALPAHWPAGLVALRYTASEYTDAAPRPPLNGS